jgi:hypothetical protein
VLGDAGTPQTDESANLKKIREKILLLEDKEQWEVIYHLIRQRLGDDPQHGAALTDPDGRTYLFLVPPHLMEKPEEDDAENVTPAEQEVSADRFLDIINQEGDAAAINNRLYELGNVTR